MTEPLKRGFFFPERVVSRWARYVHDVQALAIEGASEPRRWIAAAEGFWAGVADDCAAGLRALGYGEEPPPCGYTDPTNLLLKSTQNSCDIPFTIPIDAFRALGSSELSLWPSEFHLNQMPIATAVRNLRLTPRAVTIEDRCVTLRVYDLPQLTAGMVLSGGIWASAADPASAPQSGSLLVTPVRIFVEP